MSDGDRFDPTASYDFMVFSRLLIVTITTLLLFE